MPTKSPRRAPTPRSTPLASSVGHQHTGVFCARVDQRTPREPTVSAADFSVDRVHAEARIHRGAADLERERMKAALGDPRAGMPGGRALDLSPLALVNGAGYADTFPDASKRGLEHPLVTLPPGSCP